MYPKPAQEQDCCLWSVVLSQCKVTPLFSYCLKTKRNPVLLFNITHCCPFLFSTKHLCRSQFTTPQMFWGLTHTGIRVLFIQVLGSHSYTQRGLTHIGIRVLSRKKLTFLCEG